MAPPRRGRLPAGVVIRLHFENGLLAYRTREDVRAATALAELR